MRRQTLRRGRAQRPTPLATSNNAAACPIVLQERRGSGHCSSLPEFARNRRFAMSEIEGALMARGKQISPGLLGYGNASGSGAQRKGTTCFSVM